MDEYKNPQNQSALNKIIDERALEVVKTYLKTAGFTDRKLTDTPTDNLAVVNRKFVTMNGTTTNRPTGSILGQRYFDTSLNKPVYWNGSTWVDATGSVV